MSAMTKVETKTQHTPGPWHVAGHGNGKRELPILRNDGKEIACIRAEAHLADAKLIAAAPELLAVARLVGKVRGEHGCGFGRPIWWEDDASWKAFVELDEAAMAAIAKAEGNE